MTNSGLRVVKFLGTALKIRKRFGEFILKDSGQLSQHILLLDLLCRIPILTYHKVDQRQEIGINTISPARFRRHIDWLAQAGYQTITFQDLLESKPLPPKPVIISFDDAYECVYQYVLPVFQEYHFRGVVFVVAGFIGQVNSWDANLGGIYFRHMSQAQLMELGEFGWEIGAHTLTHRALSFLNIEQLKKEVFETQRILTSISQRAVVSIAYPFGLHNQQVRKVVKSAGFWFGCKGMRKIKDFELLQLPRVPVYQFESLNSLQRKLKMPNLPLYERMKSYFLSWPSILTPCYQSLFKTKLL